MKRSRPSNILFLITVEIKVGWNIHVIQGKKFSAALSTQMCNLLIQSILYWLLLQWVTFLQHLDWARRSFKQNMVCQNQKLQMKISSSTVSQEGEHRKLWKLFSNLVLKSNFFSDQSFCYLKLLAFWCGGHDIFQMLELTDLKFSGSQV